MIKSTIRTKNYGEILEILHIKSEETNIFRFGFEVFLS